MSEDETRGDIGKLLDAVRGAAAVQMLPDPKFPGINNCSGCGAGNFDEQPVIHRPGCPTVTLRKLCAEMTAKYQAAEAAGMACPFCGYGVACMSLETVAGEPRYRVRCPRCGSEGPPCETEIAAAGAWGKRSPVTPFTGAKS